MNNQNFNRQEELEDEQIRAQKYLEVTGAVVVVLDTRGQVLRINPAGCRLLGYNREQIEGRNWVDSFIPEAWRKTVRQVTRRNVERADDIVEHFENPVLTKDGEERMCVWDNTTVSNKAGEVEEIIATGMDITERKRAEEALQYRLAFEKHIITISNRFVNLHSDEIDSGIYNALAKIGQFVEADRAYIFQFNDEQQFMSNTHEWCAESVAPQIEKLQDIPADSLPWWTKKLKNFETIHLRNLDELPPEAENTRKVLEPQNINSLIVVPLTLEKRLAGFIGFDKVSQETEWSSDTVNLLQTVGEIIANTLQRQRTEATLRNSEEKYRRMFELSPEVIVLLDIQGNVVEVNGRLDDWLGYRTEEVKGKNLMELPYLPEHSKEKLKARFAERMKGVDIPPYELDLVTRNGELRTGLIHATPLTDTEGHINADLVITADITERKRAEEALEETNRQLEATVRELQDTQQQIVDQERQQALTTMASGISHNFNNALSPITGYADLLLQYPSERQDDNTLTQYLNHIRTAASNAAGTVRRMRKFYRPREEISFTEIDLNRIITEAVSLTQPRWKEEASASGRDIDVQTDLAEFAPIVGAEVDLHDMLTNLIFNAVDAMPEGGTIHIKTWAEENEVQLVFSDTGVGMPEDIRRKCTEPFFTTKGVGGSGLGLATVKGTVDRHGGEMSIETAQGQGTTFRITFPQAERSELQDAGQADAESEPHKPYNLLVIEDDEGQRELLRALLTQEGHHVDVAQDGEEGLQYFHAGTYDAVITDRAMPKMSGDQVAQAVKETAPGKPVIMLTGFGDMMDAAGDKVDAVDLVISKPLTLDKIREALQQVVE